MKKIIIIIAITWIITNLFSITIPGATYNSDTTWTLANSPYSITGDVIVGPNATLTIEAGVVMKYSTNVELTINGRLYAVGTPTQRITFNSNALNRYWDGIIITNSPSTTISYCNITQTKKRGAIVSNNSTRLLISYSDFYNNYVNYIAGTVHASALNLKNDINVTISHNNFYNNTTYFNTSYQGSTIYLCTESSITTGSTSFDNNNIHDNEASNGGAIQVLNASNSHNYQITSNTIESNSVSSQGSGIFLGGLNANIQNNIITNNTAGFLGGGIFVNATDFATGRIPISITDNVITNNTASEGAGIYISGTDERAVVIINNNTIMYNNTTNKGGGLYMARITTDTSNPTQVQYNKIAFNKASNGGAGLYIHDGSFDINKCNILYNESDVNGSAILVETLYFSQSYVNVKNSILWGNNYTQFNNLGSIPSTLSFSCIENGSNSVNNVTYSTNNLSTNPNFLDIYTYNWHLGLNSSCIGTGQNGTDIGVYSYSSTNNSSKFIHSVHSGINWISFPKLDRNIETNPSVPINTPLAGLGGNGSLIVDDQLSPSTFNLNTWSTFPLGYINTTKGYKLSVSNNGTFDVYGKTVNPLTSISLQNTPANSTFENWIGYFIPQSQTPQEAFGETMNSLLSIKTETWSMTRASLTTPWFTGSTPKTINYGDMVVVKTGLDASISFQWNSIASEAEAMLVAPAQLFSYTQQADYTPVYVTYSDENPPAEIAVLANGEVRGASVYEGEVTQINAYLTPEDADAEITFAFAYDSKQAMKQIASYSLYKDNDYISANFPLSYQPATPFYAVKIGEKANTEVMPMISQVRNYPNPFNPETTIDFMTAKEGNVKITIFNIKGQKVCELFNGVLPNGSHQLNWNGKDQNNNKVGTGIYFYTISTHQSTVSRKMTLIK